MVRWDDPQHLMVNSLASLAFAAAVLWALSSAARAHRQGWRGKVVLFLTLSVGVYVDGFYIPLGTQGQEPARDSAASTGGG